MTAKHVTLLLVPGMASPKIIYGPLVDCLSSNSTIAPVPLDHPSVDAIATNADLSPNPLEADIASLRHTLTSLIEHEQKNVFIMAHSYGGIPALYASSGLWAYQRAAKNQAGGIHRILLVSSALCLPSESVLSVRATWAAQNPTSHITSNDDTGMAVEMHDGLPFIIPKATKFPAWFNDLDPPEQQKWGARLKPTALEVVTTPVPETGHGDPREWRISYLVCGEIEQSMPEAFQEYLVERAVEAGVEAKVEGRIRSGHFVQISHPEELAKWVREMVEKHYKEPCTAM